MVVGKAVGSKLYPCSTVTSSFKFYWSFWDRGHGDSVTRTGRARVTRCGRGPGVERGGFKFELRSGPPRPLTGLSGCGSDDDGTKGRDSDPGLRGSESRHSETRTGHSHAARGPELERPSVKQKRIVAGHTEPAAAASQGVLDKPSATVERT